MCLIFYSLNCMNPSQILTVYNIIACLIHNDLINYYLQLKLVFKLEIEMDYQALWTIEVKMTTESH